MQSDVRTSGIVVVRRTRRGNVRVLLLQRANGEYDIPKGRVELGEDPFDAALREAEEETGVEVDAIEDVSCEVVTSTGARYRFYLGTTNEKWFELTEHVDIFWLPVDEALDLLEEDTPHLALAVRHLTSRVR